MYTVLQEEGQVDDPVSTDPNRVFSVRDGTIKVLNGRTGHIASKKSFSHYRVRVQARFQDTGSNTRNQNAGLLYHIRQAEPSMGIYPRSIEFQGQKRGMGEMWTISGVLADIKVTDVHLRPPKYKSDGTLMAHGDHSGRQCLGGANPYADGQWNTMEVVVRGADSTTHIVNGVVVLRAARLRVKGADNNDFSKPLNSGAIGLQSEGSRIQYRNFMIMELDPVSGKPLHAKTVSTRHFAAEASLPLRAAAHGGGWTIRWNLSGHARARAATPRLLRVRTLDGRVLDALPLPGYRGTLHWTNRGRTMPRVIVLEIPGASPAHAMGF